MPTTTPATITPRFRLPRRSFFFIFITTTSNASVFISGPVNHTADATTTMLHLPTVKKEPPSSATNASAQAGAHPTAAAADASTCKAPIVKRNLHLLSVMCPAKLSTNTLQLSHPPRMFQTQPDGRHFIPPEAAAQSTQQSLCPLSQNNLHLQRQLPLPMSPG